MALPSRIPRERDTARQASREILIWTTRDGREIPLDEMSDEHVANAVRVLSLWRTRLKRRGGDETVIRDLKDAIERFKSLQRRRRKALLGKSRKALPGKNRKATDGASATATNLKRPLALPKPVRSKPKASAAYPGSSPSSKSASKPPSRWGRGRKPVART